MSHQVALVTLLDGQEHRLPITAAPIRIGRAPESELSLIDDQVSWHHATVWIEEGALWVQDHMSTNGTFVNGERLRDAAMLSDSDEVRLGARVTLRIMGQVPVDVVGAFVLEELTRGLRVSIAPGTTALTGPTATRLGVEAPGELSLSPDGDLTLILQGTEIPLTLGEPFDIGDSKLRVNRRSRIHSGTVGQDHEPYPYRLTIRLDGPRGSEALLLDRQSNITHRVSAENRVVLLYLLARKIREDQQAGTPPVDLGWCDDADLTVGVWGKGPRATSSLAVLVHRLRKELIAAGFDDSFLQKERLILRANLQDVHID
jgi:hypothetical protein